MNHRRYQPSTLGGWYFFTQITIRAENTINRYILQRKAVEYYRTR